MPEPASSVLTDLVPSGRTRATPAAPPRQRPRDRGQAKRDHAQAKRDHAQVKPDHGQVKWDHGQSKAPPATSLWGPWAGEMGPWARRGIARFSDLRAWAALPRAWWGSAHGLKTGALGAVFDAHALRRLVAGLG